MDMSLEPYDFYETESYVDTLPYLDPVSSGSFVTYDHRTFGDPVNHYFNKVLGVQYLLGDKKTLFYIMTNSVYSPNPTACRKAVEMLSDVHIRRIQNPIQPALDSEAALKLKRIQTWLESQDSTDPDTAMAALHYISLYLFDGGSGAWEGFLKVAGKYVSKILYHGGYTSPLDALQSCSEKDAFVIKTVLWFDVLASITTQRPPYFFSAIDEMFSPSQVRIENEQSSMMNPMGCENIVLWALTKTSELSYWKKLQQARGSLSIPDLVKRAGMIEQYLEHSTSTIYDYDPSLAGFSADKAACSRYHASELFRTSALLFLRSVVSGNYPHVKEIKVAVHDTMACIRNIPPDAEIRRSVVRSTVFSFFICGSLTDDQRNLEYLGRILTHESGGESGVGNCNHIYALLCELWKKRDPNVPGPIEWRECLKQNDSQFLLV
ncbi:fungal-specific transcription factor domain-containing protein [Crucibulum laeve]|uniref:Fungal-specific transcription factor domain-containing protein n=1 Tax=Crucibulum laeve TaxID=68775 RepID=A0A5C3LJA2_9AGAR|nr:fungal-specific transcription factor domain-containing protein [Crucibulum laeve]